MPTSTTTLKPEEQTLETVVKNLQKTIEVFTRPKIDLTPNQALELLNPPAEAPAPDGIDEELRRMIEAESAADDQPFEFKPSRIRIASGGSGHFQFNSGEMEATLTGVVALAQTVRGYWPTDKITSLPPLCSSPNGQSGYWSNVDDQKQIQQAQQTALPHRAIELLSYRDQEFPESFDCKSCVMNQWGSAPGGGRGKGCKEMRRLLIILDGHTMPAVLTLPPTSLKNYDEFFSGIVGMGQKYWLTRIELTQTKVEGEYPHGIVNFKRDPQSLDPEQIRAVIAIRQAYESLIKERPVTSGEYAQTEEETPPF